MNRKDRIMARVTAFYAQHPPVAVQIVHTQSVAAFTRMIAVGEALSEAQTELQEVAAWLHDVGCPEARRLHGKALPVYQEQEGARLVREWLEADPDFTTAEVEWLADAVGGHHRFARAKACHFEPLFEADLIVNLIEGYYAPSQAQNFIRNMVTTSTGRALFRTLFGVASEE